MPETVIVTRRGRIGAAGVPGICGVDCVMPVVVMRDRGAVEAAVAVSHAGWSQVSPVSATPTTIPWPRKPLAQSSGARILSTLGSTPAVEAASFARRRRGSADVGANRFAATAKTSSRRAISVASVRSASTSTMFTTKNGRNGTPARRSRSRNEACVGLGVLAQCLVDEAPLILLAREVLRARKISLIPHHDEDGCDVSAAPFPRRCPNRALIRPRACAGRGERGSGTTTTNRGPIGRGHPPLVAASDVVLVVDLLADLERRSRLAWRQREGGSRQAARG